MESIWDILGLEIGLKCRFLYSFLWKFLSRTIRTWNVGIQTSIDKDNDLSHNEQYRGEESLLSIIK